ncbi:uncharacterized protein C22orf15 homolog isoform X1 [Pelodiscus sinensis]|uniref:uncharacterized protein C22orf15 homolog isoform X1 n=1 Tax=Pelodiscus sinensis TaxID=13735 RepID=UPI003F6B330E
MFITVSYGADCHEIVNVQCRVLSLTAHLKRKCQCRPEDCVDLLDESGTLMNLSQVESPGSELARKYLQERQHYILIRVVRGENSEPTCYESLLENLEEHHPELAGENGYPSPSNHPRNTSALDEWFPNVSTYGWTPFQSINISWTPLPFPQEKKKERGKRETKKEKRGEGGGKKRKGNKNKRGRKGK